MIKENRIFLEIISNVRHSKMRHDFLRVCCVLTQLPPDFKTLVGNERKADVFQSQTYSIGTSKSVERFIALLSDAKRTDKDQNGSNGDESAQSNAVLCVSFRFCLPCMLMLGDFLFFFLFSHFLAFIYIHFLSVLI